MMTFHNEATEFAKNNTQVEINDILELSIRDEIARLKNTPESEIENIVPLIEKISSTIQNLKDNDKIEDFGINKVISGI